MSGGHITGYRALPSIAEEIERIIAEQDLGPEVSGRYRLAVQHARRAYEAVRAVDYLESGDYGRESFVQAWDEYVKTAPGDLESSRAEVEQARIELEDERERVNVQREDIRTLRGEVQRIQRERDTAIDERNAWRSGHQDVTHEADRLCAEVQRLTEEVIRSDAGRVEVPELTDDEINVRLYADRPAGPNSDEDWAWFMRRQCRWAYYLATSRLSPSPQPATGGKPSADVVVVPMAEYKALESVRYHAQEVAAGIREMGPSRLSEPLEHALAHLYALRSSTNHEQKEARDAGD